MPSRIRRHRRLVFGVAGAGVAGVLYLRQLDGFALEQLAELLIKQGIVKRIGMVVILRAPHFGLRWAWSL